MYIRHAETVPQAGGRCLSRRGPRVALHSGNGARVDFCGKLAPRLPLCGLRGCPVHVAIHKHEPLHWYACHLSVVILIYFGHACGPMDIRRCVPCRSLSLAPERRLSGRVIARHGAPVRPGAVNVVPAGYRLATVAGARCQTVRVACPLAAIAPGVARRHDISVIYQKHYYVRIDVDVCCLYSVTAAVGAGAQPPLWKEHSPHMSPHMSAPHTTHGHPPFLIPLGSLDHPIETTTH